MGQPQRPEKICPACGRPFQWRKKWERDWDHVKFCSDKCRRQGEPKAPGAPSSLPPSAARDRLGQTPKSRSRDTI